MTSLTGFSSITSRVLVEDGLLQDGDVVLDLAVRPEESIDFATGVHDGGVILPAELPTDLRE